MHVYDSTIDHPLPRNTIWQPSQAAERVNDHIWLSRSNSYPHLIAGPAGDVILNTGTAAQGARHRERFEQALGRPLDVVAIILTQSHHDHIGGWSFFNGPGVRTIVAANYDIVLEERQRIAPWYRHRRTADMFTRRTIPGEAVNTATFNTSYGGAPLPVPTDRVDREAAFTLAGRRYVLAQAPGGESLDGLTVWLPDEATVLTGNLTGAIWGALPHLSTIRGDRPRSARLFIECAEAVLAREPELLLTGHDTPIRGRDRIRAELGRVVEAVRLIREATLDGMGEGRSLPELMATIRLPAALEPRDGRGPVSWAVRAVWEEYAGWFRAESVTELYPTLPSAIWPELVALAGGPDQLARRAQARLDAGSPVEALHFTDMILSVDPRHRAARDVEFAALGALRAADGDRNYDLCRYIELEMRRSTKERDA
jgi:alkyl sulfatase BDS1-like metallo-beta-lactamase superfamily hydrolase